MRVRTRLLIGGMTAPLLSINSVAGAGSNLRLVATVKHRDTAAARGLLKLRVDINTLRRFQSTRATSIGFAHRAVPVPLARQDLVMPVK